MAGAAGCGVRLEAGSGFGGALALEAGAGAGVGVADVAGTGPADAVATGAAVGSGRGAGVGAGCAAAPAPKNTAAASALAALKRAFTTLVVLRQTSRIRLGRRPRPSTLQNLVRMAVSAAQDAVLSELQGDVAVVTMNRPQRRNALSQRQMEALIETFVALDAGAQASVVILAASGPVFCSGHDLSEMQGDDTAYYRRQFHTCSELMQTIQSIRQPVIAQVQGTATAAGCQLVATCDLAVAAENALFATPGVKIGLFCSTPMVALSRAVGRKKALEMLLTGEFVSAPEALAAGLINKVVPAQQLEAETRQLARKIAAASRAVVRIGKQAFYRQIELPQAEAYAYAEQVMADNAAMQDAHEGIGAFLEKRRPRWPD